VKASLQKPREYTAVGAVTPTYDARGNITSGYGGGLTLEYDAENRLVSAGGVSYAYDLLGRRISRTSGGTTTVYVWDGAHVVAEYTNGSLARKYVYGPGMDNPAAMILPGDVRFYYFPDALGSIRLLVYYYGEVSESYTYDLFGRPRVMRSAGADGDWLTEDVATYNESQSWMGNPYMFTGRRWDGDTGLYYYRMRDYGPDLGRFLQADPAGYVDGMNLYAYCGNNPGNWVDPWGMVSWRRVAGGFKCVGGLIEFGAGVSLCAATSWTGVGAAGGALVAAHGADVGLSGWRQMLSGEQTDSFTSQNLQAFGMSRQTANNIDTTISTIGSAGAGAATASIKTCQIMRLPEAQGKTVSQVLAAWEKGSTAFPDEIYNQLGGNMTNALQKAQMMEQGIIQGTHGIHLWEAAHLISTGLTPLGNVSVGVLGAACAQTAGAMDSSPHGMRLLP